MNPLRKTCRLIFRLLKIGVTNPRRLSHVLGTALSASDDVLDKSCDLLQLPQVDVNDLLPTAGEPGNQDGDVSQNPRVHFSSGIHCLDPFAPSAPAQSAFLNSALSREFPSRNWP